MSFAIFKDFINICEYHQIAANTNVSLRLPNIQMLTRKKLQITSIPAINFNFFLWCGLNLALAGQTFDYLHISTDNNSFEILDGGCETQTEGTRPSMICPASALDTQSGDGL